jgi:hypothetical protein
VASNTLTRSTTVSLLAGSVFPPTWRSYVKATAGANDIIRTLAKITSGGCGVGSAEVNATVKARRPLRAGGVSIRTATNVKLVSDSSLNSFFYGKSTPAAWRTQYAKRTRLYAQQFGNANRNERF